MTDKNFRMKKFKIFSLWLVFLLLFSPGAAQAAQAVLTATVMITPLSVLVSFTPHAVFKERPFKINATIKNNGDTEVQEVRATLHLPSGLNLVEDTPEKEIGSLPPSRKKRVSWKVKADATGSYVILVTAQGKDKASGALVIAQGDTVVTINASSPGSLFHFLWRYFLIWPQKLNF